MSTARREIDQNDVDISELFKWSTSVTISDPGSGVEKEVYIRLVGDADINKARSYALRKSAELRKKLRTEGTDERIAFVNELDEFQENDTIIEMIMFLLLPEHQRQAVREAFLKEPVKPPSTAGLEAQEQYQIDIDNYPDEFADTVEEELDRIQSNVRKRLKGKHKSTLYETYEGLMMDRLCSEEMNEAFYDMCVYNGSFMGPDFKKKAFKSFEDYENASSHVKRILKNAYENLELGTDQLKKSPEATQ